MANYLEQYFQRWLNRRIPPRHDITLNQRRIFIFPGVQTLYFFAVLLLLFVAGINYQNNLAYALVFFLLSLFNTSIIFTYLNVSQLRLCSGKATQVFAGDFAEFEIELNRLPGKAHHRLHFSWPDNPVQVHDLVREDRKVIRLHCKTLRRGIFRPGRLLLESYYPLGLIRCWSWIDLDFETIVYPRPISTPQQLFMPAAGESGRESPLLGKEDFFGFRDYVRGDPLRQVDWRSLARGQNLQTKVYAARQSETHWVDWHALQVRSTEERLSRLCDWVLQLDRKNVAYGLRLPGIEISPGMGEVHRRKVLVALALFNDRKDVKYV